MQLELDIKYVAWFNGRFTCLKYAFQVFVGVAGYEEKSAFEELVARSEKKIATKYP